MHLAKFAASNIIVFCRKYIRCLYIDFLILVLFLSRRLLLVYGIRIILFTFLTPKFFKRQIISIILISIMRVSIGENAGLGNIGPAVYSRCALLVDHVVVAKAGFALDVSIESG